MTLVAKHPEAPSTACHGRNRYIAVTYFFFVSYYIPSYLRFVINRSVALYYSGQTAVSLRCFRLALVLRHKLLRSNGQHILDKEVGEPASETAEGSKQASSHGTREDTIAAEAGEAAAAITLNNFAVCLAGIGDTIAATQALVISSTMTT